MLISSKNLLLTAREGGFAIPHFNFWDEMSARAHVAAAEKKNVPILLAWAQKHEADIDIDEALILGKFYGAHAKVPIVLHLDHGFSPDLVKYGIDHGFTSVMIDASAEKFDKNVAVTKDVVDYAHQRGVVVEAAVEFVKRTNVDSLAVSIGTSHGVYKSAKTPHLNFERLSELRQAVAVPLVLHGGSSSGDENLSKAAALGITKVNIYTDLANAALHAAQAEPYESVLKMIEAEQKAVEALDEHYVDVFNTAKLHQVEEKTVLGAL